MRLSHLKPGRTWYPIDGVDALTGVDAQKVRHDGAAVQPAK